MADRTVGGEPVRVLVKAMAVLDLLAESHDEMSLGEIAARLELNKSTCFRILNTLASEDFVERPSAGHYRLGVGAFRIASAMARRMGVRDRALPAMQELYRATGESVFLIVPRGEEAVCIERLDGRYATTHTLRVGGVLPLHLGAGPRLLLASLPREQKETYFAGAFARRVVPGLREDALRSQLTRIEADGYAISEDDIEVGVTALSAPIRDHTGDVVAALSFSGLSAHLPEAEREQQVRTLLDAARAASRSLGAR